ncbi:retrotransposon ORF1 [Tanacetum coccineum]
MTQYPPKGVVRFINKTDEVTYKMSYKIEQYDSLSDLEKEHTKSVYLRNKEDKRRGVEYVMNKILGFYKECLDLGPEYLTGVEDRGEVMLYLMRRSLEVLRKFHWMILGGRFNQLSHIGTLKFQQTMVDMLPLRTADAAYSKIKGMLSTLGDPFTRIISPKEYQSFRIGSDGNVQGVESYKDHSLLFPCPKEKDIISLYTVVASLKTVSHHGKLPFIPNKGATGIRCAQTATNRQKLISLAMSHAIPMSRVTLVIGDGTRSIHATISTPDVEIFKSFKALELKNMEEEVKLGFQPETRLRIGYGVLEFLGVGTTFDIFQNIHILYLEYGVLSFSGYGVLSLFPLWSLVSAGTDTSYLP